MRPRVSSRFLEGLLYALTVFAVFAFGSVEPWSRAGLEILAFLLALACFLRGRSSVSGVAADFWLFPAFFAALGVVQLQTVVPADGPRPWGPFTSAPHATETAVLLWAAYAAILWSVPRILITHEAARRYVRFLFGMGIVLAVFGLAQAGTAPDKLYWLRDASRAGFGPFYNRDDGANVLMMSMAAGIGLFFSRVRRGAALDGSAWDHFRAQAALVGGVGLLFAGVLACGSRGALLAIMASAAALVFFGADFAKSARRRRVRAGAALVAAAFAVFFVFQYTGAGADAGARVEQSIMGRLSIYGDSRNWLRDAPLFGTGLGSFETVYPSYQDLELRATVSHAHCDWLETALESGLLGLLAALAAAAAAARAALRSWRSARSEEMRALIAGGLAAAVGFSVHALVEFCFQIPGNAVVFLGVVGFLLSAPAWADKTADRSRPSPPSGRRALAAAACFLFLAQAAARPAAAAWIADKSGAARERVAGLARAYAWDQDPYYLLSSSMIDYDAGLGPPPDVKALRGAAAYAMAALDRTPFDFEALSFAGASLWRLGRAADSRGLTADALTLRFTPLVFGSPNAKTDVTRSMRKR